MDKKLNRILHSILARGIKYTLKLIRTYKRVEIKLHTFQSYLSGKICRIIPANKTIKKLQMEYTTEIDCLPPRGKRP